MSTPLPTSPLEQRVAALERSNRRLRAAISALLVGAAGTFFIAANSDTPAAAQLQTEELVLTKNGQAAATLNAGSASVVLRIAGKPVAVFYKNWAGGPGGVLRLCDPEGSPLVQLGGFDSGGAVMVHRYTPSAGPSDVPRPAPRTAGYFGVNQHGGVMEVFSHGGFRAGFLQTTAQGGSLDISDKAGKAVGSFDATKDGARLFLGRDRKQCHMELKFDGVDSQVSIVGNPIGQSGPSAVISGSSVNFRHDDQKTEVSSAGLSLEEGGKQIAQLRSLFTTIGKRSVPTLRLFNADHQQVVTIIADKQEFGGGSVWLSDGARTTYQAP
jgi:hypothetical protein